MNVLFYFIFVLPLHLAVRFLTLKTIIVKLWKVMIPCLNVKPFVPTFNPRADYSPCLNNLFKTAVWMLQNCSFKGMNELLRQRIGNDKIKLVISSQKFKTERHRVIQAKKKRDCNLHKTTLFIRLSQYLNLLFSGRSNVTDSKFWNLLLQDYCFEGWQPNVKLLTYLVP